ncbi:MAG: LptF/LptG family permease [Bacteroidota bacterium]
MIKTIDKLIIKAFIGPFLATFLIALFILVIQFFWLYIDDFVGKGIDFKTLIQFVGYLTATVVPLALPLGILISSIMTFGKLGESFELMAIKSAGISLFRCMQPVLMVSGLLTITAFLFANYMIPVAELKMRTLLYDIRIAKPAFDIKEGIFYDKLDGYTLKVGKKVNDSLIKNIIVYEKNYELQDQLMLAEEGSMTVSPDQKYLYFNLKNGWRYQEKGVPGTTNTEFYRIGFKEYKKVFDLSSFRISKSADSTFRSYYKMLSYRQLGYVADSLNKLADTRKKNQIELLYASLPAYLNDSIWNKTSPVTTTSFKTIESLIPDSMKTAITNNVSSKISNIKSQSEFLFSDQMEIRKDIRLHHMEQHRKFALSFACIVFFLIGAPLGTITRKGGLGMPLVMSVLFFIIFHIINTSAEKLVKEGVMFPYSGMWLSTYILVPIGIFLMLKARKDAQPFNTDRYFMLWQKTRKYFPFGKKENKVD